MSATPLIDSLLDRISAQPRLWNTLRRLVEDDFRGERQVIASELAPRLDDRRRFLDLGCGTGEFARCFPAQRYLGVDIASVYVRFAGQTYPNPFAVMDGTLLGLAGQSFDAALLLGVLHHLDDRMARAVMLELQRVLVAGATALVIEDIPPPDRWNLAGHAMHWLDRGGYIRNEQDYRVLFGEGFQVERSYAMRSGICDYAVYVLKRL